eukprot:TRINITY_DN21909_c0_g1_i1.p1 TRINITY_DN21909_c0_g1~~TRINITY_DN21909_c0_g1_i1.p1  ORF type:complete len:163 (+),score=24.80 TRINITY_DN21909_c0_g1_i1:55-489(+)
MAKWQYAWVPIVSFLCCLQVATFAFLFVKSDKFSGVPQYIRYAIPIIFLYFLLVPTMAGFACATFASPSATSTLAALGGLLFLVSDNIILLGAFVMLMKQNRESGEPQALPSPNPSNSDRARRIAVMATYYLAQMLIGLSVYVY